MQGVPHLTTASAGNSKSGGDKPTRQSPSQAGPAAKQKVTKTALSCAECKRLKIKCSRVWPCTNCIRRKCADVCPNESSKDARPGSRTKEVRALQDRIRQLEHLLNAGHDLGDDDLQRLEDSADGLHSPDPSEVRSPVSAGAAHQASGSQAASHESRKQQRLAPGIVTPPAHEDASSELSPPLPVLVPAVEPNKGTLMLDESGRSSRYLGKSVANALLVDDEHSDAGSQASSDDEYSDLEGMNTGVTFPISTPKLGLADFQALLPPKHATDILVAAYFTNCAFIFEPIRRAEFVRMLDLAYAFTHQDNPLTLEEMACVFMVLALGLLFDLDIQARDPRAARFHRAAQACLTSANYLNIPSLASIQCLHLMCTYQLTVHSHSGAFRCWPLLGLAGRIVMSTGLHRDPGIWKIGEPDLTSRRTLFWEVFCYDRLQSLMLGRPYMLNLKHCDTLMPCPESATLPLGDPLAFNCAKFELCRLIGELCDDCFSVVHPTYETILANDKKLRDFRGSLPLWLRFRPNLDLGRNPPPLGSDEARQILHCNVINLWINETSLFLHRVAFVAALEQNPSEPLRSAFAQSVVALCLEASVNLISILRTTWLAYPRLCARWWNMQVFAFGAGVCLAAVCIKAPRSALTRAAWSDLSNVTGTLEEMTAGSSYARDLFPRLHKLQKQAQIRMETAESPEGASPLGRHESMASDSSASLDDVSYLGAKTRKVEGKLLRQHSAGKVSVKQERSSKSLSPDMNKITDSPPSTNARPLPGSTGNNSSSSSVSQIGHSENPYFKEQAAHYTDTDPELARVLATIAAQKTPTVPGQLTFAQHVAGLKPPLLPPSSTWSGGLFEPTPAGPPTSNTSSSSMLGSLPGPASYPPPPWPLEPPARQLSFPSMGHMAQELPRGMTLTGDSFSKAAVPASLPEVDLPRESDNAMQLDAAEADPITAATQYRTASGPFAQGASGARGILSYTPGGQHFFSPVRGQDRKGERNLFEDSFLNSIWSSHFPTPGFGMQDPPMTSPAFLNPGTSAPTP